MIGTLLKSVRQYWRAAIGAPLIVTVEVVMEIVIPLLMAQLIDRGINAGNLSMIAEIGLALFFAALLQLVSGIMAGRCAARASAGFAANLRHDLFARIQTFSFSKIDKYSTAGLVTRLTTDVTNLQQAFQMVTRMAFRAPLMLVFALTVAFGIHRSLSLIFLGAIPVLAIGLGLIMRRAHPIFTRVFKTYDRLNNVVQENLRGIRVVKSFCRQEYEKEKFNTISEQIYQDFSSAEKSLAFNMPLMQFCMYSCTLLISWLGAQMIVASGNQLGAGLTTGQLMSLISYAMQILMSLMMLSMVFVMITMARASAQRAVEILTEPSGLENPAQPVTTVADGDLRFEGVSFGYAGPEGRQCLREINLHIPAGQMVGILGGTGSSKSSLVQLIPRLYDVTAGSVQVGGVDVRDYDLETLRDSVAMVLQKNVLFSGTIRENLRWGNPDATDEEMRRACQISQADEFIRTFPDGYDTMLEQGGTNLSGGQKQRICIARALLKKPKILILDDSTSAVDTKTDAQIRQALRQQQPGTTVIMIAQRVSSVQHADQILVMDEGQIAACGTHEQLLQDSPIYREVYQSQQKGGK